MSIRCPCLPVLAGLLTTTLASAEPAATDTTASRSFYDLLGGATWSERRLTATAGLPELEVDGYAADQRTLMLGITAEAVSGYRAGPERPAGGILGLGASLRTWWGNDDVRVKAVAPFALAVAGGYTRFNERTRLDLVARAGPGLAVAKVGDESRNGLAWTWALEGSMNLVAGDNAGLGVALGYESTHLKDIEHSGPYIALRFGF